VSLLRGQVRLPRSPHLASIITNMPICSTSARGR
jgi:hypothetical protein